MNLSEHFKLDPNSPSYVAWARDGRVFRTGDPVARLHGKGYFVAQFGGRTYLMHRVVYELVHGHCPPVIDHIDGNKRNNHPDNLRPATHTTNKWNVGKVKHNTSGVKGLSWNNKRACWVGRVCHGGRVSQKYSKDRAVVEAWLIATRNELHKEYANHG